MSSPTLQGALKNGSGEAVVACDMLVSSVAPQDGPSRRYGEDSSQPNCAEESKRVQNNDYDTTIVRNRTVSKKAGNMGLYVHRNH